jgi:hypothetical protein
VCVDESEEGFTDLLVCVINASNLKDCPRVKLRIGDSEVTAILDSGEEIYENLVARCVQVLCLTVVGRVLISAWGARTKRIRKKAVLHFDINDSFSNRFSWLRRV